MKKKLALLLAASVVLSCMPVTAYGKSANSISRVVSVKEDTELNRDWEGQVPRLEIVSDKSLPITLGTTIRLTLTNAEWLDGKDAADKFLHSGDVAISGVNATISQQDISVRKVSSSQIELAIGAGKSGEKFTPNISQGPKSSSGNIGTNAQLNSNILDMKNFDSSGTGNFSVELYATQGGYFTAQDRFALDTDAGIDVASKPDIGDFSNQSEIRYGLKVESVGDNNLFSEDGISGNVITFLANEFGSNTQAGWFEDKYQVFEISWIKAVDTTNGAANDYAEDIKETKEIITLTIYPNAKEGAVTDTNDGNIGADTVITLPMLTKITDVGDATVTVESISGSVTDSVELFATVQTGNTTTKSDGNLTISSGVTTKRALKNIIIDEVSVGALNGNTYIRFKAPADFELYTNNFKIAFVGGLLNTYSSDMAATGSPYITTTGEGSNELTVYFWDGEGKPHQMVSQGSKGTMILSGLQIRATDESPFGAINLTLSGNEITKETIRVGNYRDFGVTMTASEPTPVIVAGYHPGAANNSKITDEEEIEASEITIKEGIANSLWKTRKMTLSVPDGVEIRAAIFKDSSDGDEHILYKNNDADIQGKTVLNFTEVGSKYSGGTLTLHDNYLEFLNVGSTSKSSFYIKLFLSVEPGYSGDIEATLSNTGLEGDLSTVIAKAVGPVGIAAEQTNVPIGYKNIAAQDITITENLEGAIKKEYTPVGEASKSAARLEIQIEDGDYLRFDSVGAYEVTQGDIVLDAIKVKNGQIQIEVKTESSVASTIVLKGVTLHADRTPPEGAYSLNVGGKAIFSNFDDGNEDYFGFFDTRWLELEKAFIVTTAATGSGLEFIPFVQMAIDRNRMLVGADTIEMDAAPYIAEGRTMLPVRYIANAFGVNNEQIYYDAAAKTITFITQYRTVQMQVDSAIMTVNGDPVQMDVAPEITNGRTFIPVVWIAAAFGTGSPIWDEEAKTVTFNKELTPDITSVGIEELAEEDEEAEGVEASEESNENRRGGGSGSGSN